MDAVTVEYTVLCSEACKVDTESDKNGEKKLRDTIKRERPSIPEGG